MKQKFFMIKTALAALGLMLLISCVSAPVESPKKQKSDIPIELQEEVALEKYNDILQVVLTTPIDKMGAVLNDRYMEIIRDYPDSFYAEESYFRLMQSRIKYFWPPDFDGAEKHYAEYIRNYPKSERIVNLMNDYMVRTYYYYEQWSRMVTFLQPYLKNYIATGDAKPVHFMYYYSIAKFKLKDYEEARKGFDIVINQFPGSAEARNSAERLKDIDAAEKQIQGGDRK